jgi:ABC-2 type transport system ATP-binding protein
VIGGGEGLHRWLSQRTDVQNIFVDGELVRFTHEGGREAQADFLKEMVLAGFRIAEFATHQKTLEDVFMHVTRGAVQ